MAVEACRLLGPDLDPGSLWFSTAEPAYLDKTNATAVHTALRLDDDVLAMDVGGAIRSGVGALKAALDGNGTILVVSSDMRTGLPTSADESQGGDGAAAALVGDGDVIAEYLGGASATREFLERWRTPGDRRSKTWEDRFGESMYSPLAEQAWNAALKAADVTEVDVLCVAGMHARSVGRISKRLGVSRTLDLSQTVGDTGTAQALLLLAAALEAADRARSSRSFRSPTAPTSSFSALCDRRRPTRTLEQQIADAADVPYARFLSWRGMVTPEPPNRPEPARVSAPAAERGSDWKFGFMDDARSLADTQGTIATFTVDRLAYSPSPPIVFAIVDFDGGGRFPMELTDVDADDGQGGRPRGDDVPQAVNGRRHPQLLLEGEARQMSITNKVAIVASSCTPFGEHWDRGTDDLLQASGRRGQRANGRDPRRVLAGHCAIGDERDHAGASPATRRQAHHARRELLRVGVRGAAQRRVRRRVRCARRRHGHRRGEGEGLRLPGPQRLPDPRRRNGSDPYRCRDVQPRDPGLRQPLRRVRGRDARRARAHRIPQPRQRREESARPVPPRDVEGDRCCIAEGRRTARRARLCRRGRRRRRGDRRAGRGRDEVQRQAACTSRPCRSLPGQGPA